MTLREPRAAGCHRLGDGYTDEHDEVDRQPLQRVTAIREDSR